MEGPSKAAMAKTIDAFVDTSDSDLETVDRSCLQSWAQCPFQAAEIEAGRAKIVGLAAEAGSAIHNALSVVTRQWVEDGNKYDTTYIARDEMRNELECQLRKARPDLQPEVLKGMMPSLWAWAKFITSISPANILAFDGGEDIGKSAQLAYDFPDLGTRATAELDLLYACKESTELIEWLDYKTGHATHEVYDVADSFQFQMHACLVLKHYPDVKAARLRVWDTRANRVTYAVTFPRTRFHDFEWRLRAAVEARRRYRDNPPTWPTQEGCRVCPVAARCPVAEYPLKAEPVDLLRDLIAVEARADAIRERLAAVVDSTGRDVVCEGVAFGRNKPTAERKKPAAMYSVKE